MKEARASKYFFWFDSQTWYCLAFKVVVFLLFLLKENLPFSFSSEVVFPTLIFTSFELSTNYFFQEQKRRKGLINTRVKGLKYNIIIRVIKE